MSQHSSHPDALDPAAWTLRERTPEPRRASRMRRAGLLLLVVLAHGLLLDHLRQQTWDPREPNRPRTTTLVFVLEESAPAPAPPPPVRRSRERELPPRAMSRPIRSRSAPPDPPRLAGPADVPAVRRTRLYRADGSLEMPASVTDDLAKATAADRQFDFQVPGVVEAQAQVPRASPLPYEETRFEDAWVKDQDPLTAALKKAVEKTTVTIRIPLPRAPGSKLVCKASLAAMAGGCGFRSESDGYFVRLDDPDTLDAAEVTQCEAWWNDVVTAATPERLRVARDRYDAQCRKPHAAAVASPR